MCTSISRVSSISLTPTFFHSHTRSARIVDLTVGYGRSFYYYPNDLSMLLAADEKPNEGLLDQTAAASKVGGGGGRGQ